MAVVAAVGVVGAATAAEAGAAETAGTAGREAPSELLGGVLFLGAPLDTFLKNLLR
jgi:hypothetical protein